MVSESDEPPPTKIYKYDVFTVLFTSAIQPIKDVIWRNYIETSLCFQSQIKKNTELTETIPKRAFFEYLIW